MTTPSFFFKFLHYKVVKDHVLVFSDFSWFSSAFPVSFKNILLNKLRPLLLSSTVVCFTTPVTHHYTSSIIAENSEVETVARIISKIKNISLLPCWPLGLREVEAPKFLRQTANRWRQGCQPYAPAALYPQVSFLRFLELISVTGWVETRAILRPEGLGKFEKIHLIGTRSRELPACSIVP
jgi:hypothetical protein